MAAFITGNEINLSLENLIKDADDYLLLISPYIKLHDRLKDELKAKISNHDLEITILFGKNESDASKSVKKEDIEFFMQFTNIKICYQKNLHAKYYASEGCSILTSMNLHQFSQNNNIEAGILMYPKRSLEQIANVIVSNTSMEDEAHKYFAELIERSELIYHAEPQFKKELFGLSKKYTGSKIIINVVDEFFKKKNPFGNAEVFESKSSYYKADPLENKPSSYQQPYQKQFNQNTAFCIRTGKSIPFNINMPYSPEAFKTWSQFQNPDYPESYCHSTGKPSSGNTSMRNPIIRNGF